MNKKVMGVSLILIILLVASILFLTNSNFNSKSAKVINSTTPQINTTTNTTIINTTKVHMNTDYIKIISSKNLPANSTIKILLNNSLYSNNESKNLGNTRFYHNKNLLYSICFSNCSSGDKFSTFWIKVDSNISANTPYNVSIIFLGKNASYSQYAGIFNNSPLNNINKVFYFYYSPEFNSSINEFKFYSELGGYKITKNGIELYTLNSSNPYDNAEAVINKIFPSTTEASFSIYNISSYGLKGTFLADSKNPNLANGELLLAYNNSSYVSFGPFSTGNLNDLREIQLKNVYNYSFNLNPSNNTFEIHYNNSNLLINLPKNFNYIQNENVSVYGFSIPMFYISTKLPGNEAFITIKSIAVYTNQNGITYTEYN